MVTATVEAGVRSFRPSTSEYLFGDVEHEHLLRCQVTWAEGLGTNAKNKSVVGVVIYYDNRLVFCCTNLGLSNGAASVTIFYNIIRHRTTLRQQILFFLTVFSLRHPKSVETSVRTGLSLLLNLRWSKVVITIVNGKYPYAKQDISAIWATRVPPTWPCMINLVGLKILYKLLKGTTICCSH